MSESVSDSSDKINIVPSTSKHVDDFLLDSLNEDTDNLEESITIRAAKRFLSDAYGDRDEVEKNNINKDELWWLLDELAYYSVKANRQLKDLQEKLAKRTEEHINQQKDLANLFSENAKLEKQLRNVMLENEGLHSSIDLAHECQSILSSELLDIRKKYSLLLNAYQELQEELKHKSELTGSPWPIASVYVPFSESLAAELDESLESDGYESGLSSLNHNRSHNFSNDLCHETNYKSSYRSSPDEDKNSDKSKENSNHITKLPSSMIQSRSCLPDKLKIVKPLEGSEFLNKWKRMATPNLDSIFEMHQGVQTKIVDDIKEDFKKLSLVKSKSNSIPKSSSKA